MPWFLKNRKFFLISLLVFGFFLIGSLVEAQPFTGMPVLYSPSHQANISSFPFSLSWGSVSGAYAGYEYRITNNTTGQKTEGRVLFSTSVGIEAFQLSMGHIHSWSVRACASFPPAVGGSGGECGDWANTREFIPLLSKPILFSPPLDSVADVPVQLKWNSVSGATNYQYFVGKGSNNAIVQNIIPNGVGSIDQNSASISIPNTEIGQIFYWQIIAKPANGQASPASAIWSFKTRFPKPVGVFPQGEIPFTGSLELKWTISNPAEEYLWYILDEKNNQIRDLNGASNSLSAQVTGIDLNRSLKWIVQACKNNRQSCSEFSNPVSFKVVLAKPVITTPEKDGEVIIDEAGSYKFAWTPMPAGQQYIYEIPNAKIKTFGGRMGNSAFVEVPKDNLLPGSSYTFRVKSCPSLTSDQNCSSFAERTFQTASLFVSSFSVSPSAGQPPLKVAMTAQAGGLGVGTVNYTFYCDSADQSPSMPFVINTLDVYKNGDTIKDDSKRVIGYKIDGVKESSFTTPEICKDYYTQGATYNPKVIIQRDNVPAAVKTIPVIVGIPNIQTNLSVSPASPLVSQEYKVNVDLFSAPGSVFEITFYENENKVTTIPIPCITTEDKTAPLGGKCMQVSLNPPATYTTSKSTAGEIFKYQAKIKYKPIAAEATPKIFDTNSVTVTIAAPPYSADAQLVVDCVKDRLKAYGNTYTESSLKSIISDCEGQYQNKIILSNADVDKLINEIRAVGGINAPATQPTTGGAPGGGGGGSWFPGVKCKNATTTPGAIDNPLCVKDFNSLLDLIINFVFWIALVLSPVMVLVAAFFYMTSAGNVAKVAQANKMLLYTAIGLGVILLARGLIAMIKGVLGV